MMATVLLVFISEIWNTAGQVLFKQATNAIDPPQAAGSGGNYFYFLGKVIFTKQSDFKSQGYFFSYVVVLIGNGLLILAICVLQKSFAQEIKMFFWDVADSYRASFFWIKHLLERG